VLYRVVHAQPDLSRVPGDIRGLVEACLAKDPGSRPGLGQVAAICASAAEHLRLSAAAFWPPDVARVIQEQAAALTAQIDALQEGPGYPSGPGAALQDASAWGSSTTAPRLDRPMTTHPPSQPSYWGPDSHPSFPPGGSLPGGPMPTGPGQGGPVPSYPLARPEYRGTSRRGLIIGAAAAGVAVVGGGAAWLVSSQSKNGTPTSSASTSPPATGATGAFSVGGKGTRRTATWKFTTGNTVSAVPTVADGVVYVGSTDGKVYAVNASTGKQVWASPAGSGTVAPQVVGDVLFMANQNGDFTALDSADGTVAWQVKGKAQAMTQRTWAADGSTVILFSYTDGMQAYDAATGNLKGKPGPPGLYVTNITAAGGVLYALDTQGTLHAIRLAGNATIWQLAVGTTDDQALSLAVGDGHVYVGTKSGTLHSVTAATGHRDWSFPGSSDLLATPVVADGMVFIVDTSGNLRAINADNGKQAWRNSVTAAVFAPAAGNGQVYLSTALTMQAWDATSGKPSWYFQPPNYKIVQATPAVADGTVYVGCSDYNLYAIKALPSSRTEACTGQNLVRKCVRNQRTHGRTGMRLRQLVIITMTAILATLAFGMAPAAKAAPGKSPGASAASVTPLVTCSGHGCDGTNPDSTGCSGTVILVDDEAGAIHNTVTGVTYTANVQLRYSTGCRTIWARILTTDPSVTVLGEIIRNSDGRTLSCTGLMALAGEFGCFTNQLYDGGVTSHARGSIVDTISGAQFNKITTSF
jgi:outer membrane protein assembly factor BamB